MVPKRMMRDHWGSRPGRGAGFQGPRQTESLIRRESKAPRAKNVSFGFPRRAVAGSLGREGTRARGGETRLTAAKQDAGEGRRRTGR